MKFHLADTDGLNTITGHGPGHVLVNGMRHDRPLLVGPDVGPLDWAVAGFGLLTEADFAALLQHEPELVLLGTGQRLRFPAPGLIRGLAQARVGIEVMDTPAACRTYNILTGEARRVLAALLFDPA
ncbi:MAG: Mth938-like domain-containing protein [bacterium]|jgi:uncharacterized protein|nr:Mth938-like domain-containing protein [Betaproteobacteria bacterium]